MLHPYCRRQTKKIPSCRSPRTGNHLNLRAEFTHTADKILKLYNSKGLEILKLKSFAKGHLLLFTMAKVLTF
jgi:hypothetical protein